MQPTAGQWHVNKKGEPGLCSAAKEPCPFGSHSSTREEAQARYEVEQRGNMFASHRRVSPPRTRSYTEEMFERNRGRYPEAILHQLGNKLEALPVRALTVMPAGSQLYNTTLPDTPVHDYDFTVITEPHRSLVRPKQSLVGELDVNLVSVTRYLEISARSTPLQESLFAYLHGNGDDPLLARGDSPYAPMMASLRLSEMKYFDLLDDSQRALNHRYEEPVRREDKANFKNFKHHVRWSIYHRRLGTNPGPFHPRLSEKEREAWLSTINSGHIATLDDFYS